MAQTRGCAMPSGRLLSVGINAAPLAAPKTGVGRYTAGLLGGLDRLSRGGPAGEPFSHRALFGPAPGREGRPPKLLAWARAAARRTPGAYALVEAARAAALERERLRGRLTVYHETNHAAPRVALPLVLTVHDLCTLLMPETQEPERARHFAAALRERTQFARIVLTPTAAIAAQVVELLGIPAARVRTVHHGLEPEFVAAAQDRALPRLALLDAHGVRGPYLLYVGALEPRKGLPWLLDAYDALAPSLLRDLPLVLAGPPDRIDEALRLRLLRPRDGRVVRLGWLEPEGLPALYRGAAAFCLPSLYEGFGLPVIEALACGVPCALSDDPALLEVAGGAALHVPRRDAPALAAALQRILEDAVLRARLARAGPLRAAGFSWDKSAAAHLQAYRDAERA